LLRTLSVMGGCHDTDIAIAMLATLIGAAPPALAGPDVPGASARPHVPIRPLVVQPSVHLRVHIPSISHHVATQFQTGQNTAPHGDQIDESYFHAVGGIGQR
jgi:hypothetical protein